MSTVLFFMASAVSLARSLNGCKFVPIGTPDVVFFNYFSFSSLVANVFIRKWTLPSLNLQILSVAISFY